MTDLAEFAQEGFDPVAWVNAAIERHGDAPDAATATTSQALERFVSELEMRLALGAEEVEDALSSASTAALRRVPHAQQEAARLRGEAAALRHAAQRLLDDAARDGTAAEAAVRPLAALDAAKRNVDAACATLREAAELAGAFRRVEDAFAAGDFPRVAEILAAMARGLAVVGDVPEFREGKARLAALQDRLVRAVEGRLAEALAGDDAAAVAALGGVLAAAGRGAALQRLYCASRGQRVSELWQEALAAHGGGGGAGEGGAAAQAQAGAALLRGGGYLAFCNALLQLLQREAEWLPAAVPAGAACAAAPTAATAAAGTAADSSSAGVPPSSAAAAPATASSSSSPAEAAAAREALLRALVAEALRRVDRPLREGLAAAVDAAVAASAAPAVMATTGAGGGARAGGAGAGGNNNPATTAAALAAAAQQQQAGVAALVAALQSLQRDSAVLLRGLADLLAGASAATRAAAATGTAAAAGAAAAAQAQTTSAPATADGNSSTAAAAEAGAGPDAAAAAASAAAIAANAGSSNAAAVLAALGPGALLPTALAPVEEALFGDGRLAALEEGPEGGPPDGAGRLGPLALAVAAGLAPADVLRTHGGDNLSSQQQQQAPLDLEALARQLGQGSAQALGSMARAVDRCCALSGGTELPALAPLLDRHAALLLAGLRSSVALVRDRARARGSGSSGQQQQHQAAADPAPLLQLALAADAAARGLASLEARYSSAAAAQAPKLQEIAADPAGHPADALALRVVAFPAKAAAAARAATVAAASGDAAAAAATRSSVLRSAAAAAEALAATVDAAVQDALLAPVAAALAPLPSMASVWAAAAPGGGAALAAVPLGFSASPLPAVTAAGEHLMALPQHLEALIPDEDGGAAAGGGGAAEEGGGDAAAAEAAAAAAAGDELAARWLDRLVLAAAETYADAVARIRPPLGDAGAAQLAADAEYLANVSRALLGAGGAPRALATVAALAAAPRGALARSAAELAARSGQPADERMVQVLAALKGKRLSEDGGAGGEAEAAAS